MDIVVFSHLRWDFVFQRPQHLLSRAARRHRVLFVEEPLDGLGWSMRSYRPMTNVDVIQPEVPPTATRTERDAFVRQRIEQAVESWSAGMLVVWHYDVMAEPLSRGLGADLVVFDCMDELSGFAGAPTELRERERRLLERADIVFAGGYSLWDAKRSHHPNVHAFPSAVDVGHFEKARGELGDPPALAAVARPRLVYAGVIDERIDLGLVQALAASGVGDVVLVGPTAKIAEDSVPRAPSIHALGMQPYADLPAIFGACDVGIMPFAHNAATRFISPTKTPEYLAAGLPVVSTSIRDVERMYGDLPSVWIADGPAFVDACAEALLRVRGDAEADRRLAGMSWDRTWAAMEDLMRAALPTGAVA